MKLKRIQSTHWRAACVACCTLFVPYFAHADIKNGQTGQVIPGTEGITPGPGVGLNGWSREDHNLREADFSGGLDLSGSYFYESWLDNADFTRANLENAHFTRANLENAHFARANLANAFFSQATLTNADFTDAVIHGASFFETTRRGFLKEQLYSTASYKNRYLAGINFGGYIFPNDLSGWNLAGQNLTNGSFDLDTMSNVDLTDAIVTGAGFRRTTSRGFTKEQLYSTTSYHNRDLSRMGLSDNFFDGWNFAGLNLGNADLSFSSLRNTDLTQANLAGANLYGSIWNNANLTDAVIDLVDLTGATRYGFSKDQLYSTSSYKNHNLRRISFAENDLTEWDFRGQNLTEANLYAAKLTNADLTAANLSNANLSSAKLTNADLTMANLRNADLSGSDLKNANLAHAVVTGSHFGVTGITNEQLYSTASYQAKDLSGIDLGGNDHTGGNFSGQNLTGANLAADLTNTNLSGTSLAGVSFFRCGRHCDGGYAATLTNANLAGANLKNAFFQVEVRGLDSAVFSADTVYNQWTQWPINFDPTIHGLTFVRSAIGDLDGTEGRSVSDVELLAKRIQSESQEGPLFMSWQFSMFDLNSDFVIDAQDLRTWVVDLKKTWFGDANVDGEFNSGDLVQVFQAGQYEDATLGNSTWSTGDWNADGEFTTSDLVMAFQDGGYEQGARVVVAAVPEPASHLVVIIAAVGLLGAGYFRSLFFPRILLRIAIAR